MPIKPENRNRYPKQWPTIREVIMERAENLCECRGECGGHSQIGHRCGLKHGDHIQRLKENPEITRRMGEPLESPIDLWEKPIKVVLTIAHLDHTPENNDGLDEQIEPGKKVTITVLPLSESNLRAYCQRCHLMYDREQHARERRRTQEAKTGQGSLGF